LGLERRYTELKMQFDALHGICDVSVLMPRQKKALSRLRECGEKRGGRGSTTIFPIFKYGKECVHQNRGTITIQ
jgi:hypothetical protein